MILIDTEELKNIAGYRSSDACTSCEYFTIPEYTGPYTCAKLPSTVSINLNPDKHMCNMFDAKSST